MLSWQMSVIIICKAIQSYLLISNITKYKFSRAVITLRYTLVVMAVAPAVATGTSPNTYGHQVMRIVMFDDCYLYCVGDN